MELAEYLRIPYVAVIYSRERPDGSWVRYAEYPELGECWAEAPTLPEAIADLEKQRVRLIHEAVREGRDIPVPRPPLGSGVSGLTATPVKSLLAVEGTKQT